MSHEIIEKLEASSIKEQVPEFAVGDTLSVHMRIKEGVKERIQVFTGTVISFKGHGVHKTFTLHRNAYGEGMERVFLLHSPLVEKVTVDRKGKVRRSKLYYLRGTSGKKSRVKELIGANAKLKKSKKQTAKKPEPVKEAPAQEQE